MTHSATGLFEAEAFLVATLLVIAAAHDMASRTIPNWVSIAILGMGALRHAWTHSLGAALLVLIGVFLGLRLLWQFGLLGGGDVKLLATTAFFVDAPAVATLTVLTAMTGGALAAAYLILPKVVARPAAGVPRTLIKRLVRCEQWRISRGGPLPYAVAIAIGGLLTLAGA